MRCPLHGVEERRTRRGRRKLGFGGREMLIFSILFIQGKFCCMTPFKRGINRNTPPMEKYAHYHYKTVCICCNTLQRLFYSLLRFQEREGRGNVFSTSTSGSLLIICHNTPPPPIHGRPPPPTPLPPPCSQSAHSTYSSTDGTAGPCGLPVRPRHGVQCTSARPIGAAVR
jgi:hypothetical protein